MRNTKKFLKLLLATVMMTICLMGCAKTQTATTSTPQTDEPVQSVSDQQEEATTNVENTEEAPSESEGSVETFTFKHGFDLDYPPYSYLGDDGSIGGFDVEMAQAVCEYLGWKYEAVPFNWDAKDAELQSGSCDCIWSGFTVEGREDDYLFSIAYSNNTQGVLVAADSGITNLDDLAGKTVGVQTATSAYDLLMSEDGTPSELCSGFGDLRIYETYTIAFNDLQAGAIDAIAIDMTAGSYLIADTNGYVFLNESLGVETYAIGFRKEDTDLCEQVNTALQALVENGTYEAIGQKYPDIYDYLCLGK